MLACVSDSPLSATQKYTFIIIYNVLLTLLITVEYTACFRLQAADYSPEH